MRILIMKFSISHAIVNINLFSDPHSLRSSTFFSLFFFNLATDYF